MIDGDGKLVETLRTTSAVVVNDAGTTVAWVDTDGDVMTPGRDGRVQIGTVSLAAPGEGTDKISDDGSCGGLVDLSSEGTEPRSKTCDHTSRTISPDGNHVIGWPAMPSDRPISVDSLLLSLKVLFDPRVPRGLKLTVAVRLGEDRFAIRIAEDHIDVTRGEPDTADVILETDPATFGALVRGHRAPEDALAAGEAHLVGSRAKAQRFLSAFPLPGSAPHRS